jgi:hypothetical protein
MVGSVSGRMIDLSTPSSHVAQVLASAVCVSPSITTSNYGGFRKTSKPFNLLIYFHYLWHRLNLPRIENVLLLMSCVNESVS